MQLCGVHVGQIANGTTKEKTSRHTNIPKGFSLYLCVSGSSLPCSVYNVQLCIGVCLYFVSLHGRVCVLMWPPIKNSVFKNVRIIWQSRLLFTFHVNQVSRMLFLFVCFFPVNLVYWKCFCSFLLMDRWMHYYFLNHE